MSTPELVLCINQSWGCQLNKTYEVIDHWKCPCSKALGLIEIRGKASIGAHNPLGLMCRHCMELCPQEVKHFFPEKWFVPLTGPQQDIAHDNESLFKPSPTPETITGELTS